MRGRERFLGKLKNFWLNPPLVIAHMPLTAHFSPIPPLVYRLDKNGTISTYSYSHYIFWIFSAFFSNMIWTTLEAGFE